MLEREHDRVEKVKRAREKAIDNIDNKFAVVGDSDNYEVTLAVLEHKLPRYFNGALKVKQNFFLLFCV